jgi:hydrogenase 3 maturation protease
MGIGNDVKGDDGVGWYVIDKIKENFEKEENLLFIKTSVPENHVKEISDFTPKLLIIIDAADFRGRPGEMRIIKEKEIAKSLVSTHTNPITVFLKLYRYQLSKQVAIIGIQKIRNDFGSPLSGPVKKSGEKLARLISRLYKDNTLDLKLEKELKYMKNPLKRLVGYFRET